MTAAQRRESIVTSLKQASGPVSASKLARELGVSRQIVVGDVALLRAAGTPVLATPRGYMLQTAPGADRMTVVCRHAQEALLDEFMKAASDHGQMNIWTGDTEHIILVSKKGHVTYKKKRGTAKTNILRDTAERNGI